MMTAVARNLRFGLSVCAFFLCTGVLSGEAEFGFQGYYKHFSLAVDRHVNDRGIPVSEPPLGVAVNRLRLGFSAYVTNRIHFQAAYDLAPRIMDPAFAETGSFLVSVGNRYRVVDLSDRLYPWEDDSVLSFAIRHNIDRLTATIQLPVADLIIGRQAVAWGSGRIVAPTDVLVPFNVTDLDVEERVGVDCVRFRIPVGALSEIDMGYVAGDGFDWDRSAAFVRGRFWVLSTDVMPTGAVIGEHMLLGLDLTRAFGGVGTWLEAAYTFVETLGERQETDENYLRITGGMDYSLTKKLYGFLEYHYSGAGKSEPGDYPLLFQSVAFSRGGVFLLGRHYVAVGGNYQFSPLISGTTQIVYNASDNSVLLGPGVEYNIREDVYLSAGGYVGVGNHADFEQGRLVPGSEFGGLYPDRYFAAFRFYF